MEASQKTSWQEGDMIAERYLLEKKIGEGGMGMVFKARDEKLAKTVAVKTITKFHDEDEILVRFHREAKIASNIDHANVVKVYDFGIAGENEPYLVMEYISGATLKAFLKKTGPFDTASGLNVLKQIASGMEAVHREGIIHRDLKTSNVILCENSDDQILVKLLDFGTARTFAADEGFKTKTGIIVGTPRYLSPEQAREEKVDERSDIYSLGCLAYELFTGKPPFDADNAMELIEKHLNETPLPPGTYQKDLPVQINDLILKMLSKNPDERIQSMPALKEEINKINLVDSPVEVVASKKSSGVSQITIMISVFALLLIGAACFLVSYLMTPSTTVRQTKPVELENPRETEKASLFPSENPESPLASITSTPKTFLFLKKEDKPKLARCAERNILIPSVIVDGYNLDDRDIKNIIALKPDWILLSRAGIQNKHLKILAECKTLRQLKFCFDPDISAEGVRYLGSLKDLEQLSLRGCDIDNQCLMELKPLKNLTGLDLEYNPKITLKGLMSLSDLKKLNSLGIYNTGVKLKPTQLADVKKKIGVKNLFITTTYDTPRAFKFMDSLRNDTKEDSLFNHTGALLTDLRVHYSDYHQNKPSPPQNPHPPD